MVKRYGELYLEARRALRASEGENASFVARELLGFASGKSAAALMADRELYASEQTAERMEQYTARALQGEPLAYILGKWSFYGLELTVTPDVLIPRDDTMAVTELAIGKLREMEPPQRVLDLCTGSGCIAISLAKLCEGLQVDAADISKEALAVAMENAAHLEADVTFWQGDLFACRQMRTDTWRKEKQENACAEAETSLPPAAYDCIVSNPPYIRTDVIETLSEEVRLHEPYQALDGKADGLYFYRRIIAEARSYLKPGGHIFFEIGYDQGEAVKNLLLEDGYTDGEVQQDLAGLDRVVTGCMLSEDKH